MLWRGWVTLAIAVLLVILGGMDSPRAALDSYWEQKIVRGIEEWMVKPLLDLKGIERSSEEYNRFVQQLRLLPAWLEDPDDPEEIKKKIPAFEKDLLAALQTLNQKKIRSLGIFNTTWTDLLVDEVNTREAENLLGRIRGSLDGKQRDRVEMVCRSCVKELKDLLSEAPVFTRQFQSTFPYARGHEAVYRGDRLVAGLIEHYKDFRAVRIRSISDDSRYSFRFAGHREIEGDGRPEPSYTFVLDPPPLSIHPAWEALGIPSRPPGSKFVAYYSLEGLAEGKGKVESLTWALLAFDTPEAARKFWTEEKKLKKQGPREFTYLSLEGVSWSGSRGRHHAWGNVMGSYLLLIQAKENAGWGGEEIEYLFGRLIRPK